MGKKNKNSEQQTEKNEQLEDAIQEPSWEEKYLEIANAVKELHEQNLRIQAEADNFKKRLEREKDTYIKYASGKIICELLPVIDNLKLAITHGQNNEACKSLIEGVTLTINIFIDILQKNGVSVVTNANCEFDPNIHEAVGQIEDNELETGTVHTVCQDGYMLHDRLLRSAKVLVSKKSE